MYSQGELSIEEYHRAMLLLSLRNRFIQGFQTPEINEHISELLALVKEVISLWAPQASGCPEVPQKERANCASQSPRDRTYPEQKSP
jgi:hypothetical protein